MKRKWKIILCILLAAAVLGGVLALCLWEREPQGDTDPNAPLRRPAEQDKEGGDGGSIGVLGDGSDNTT